MRSFLEPRLAIATLWSENPASKELSSTAWMNGLRGWAAFSVFNFHYLFAFTDIVSVGYGYDRDHRQIFALPPFRLLYDGGTCVNIFFVISGYVCSSQTLKLVSSKRMPDLGKTLSTSLFRRWFRLYLPCMCMMLITALMTHFGLFGFTDGMMAEREKFFPGPLAEDNLTRFGSLRQQLVFFATEVHQLVDIWNVKPVYAKHDPHLWTIPYEYRASIHLYLTILALAQCHCFVRLGGFVALSALHLSLGRWEMPLFLLGAAIAQYRIICDNPSSLLPNSRQSEQMPSNAAQNGENRSLLRERVSKLVRLLAFAVALYLMTYPIAGYKRPAPGYIWINNYIPRWYKRKEKLPKSIGVLMFVYLLVTSPEPRSSHWHRFLVCRLSQYLGQIMFGLYLVHGPIFHAIGYAIPHWIWRSVGNDSLAMSCFGIGFGWLLSLALCVWAADFFTRHVCEWSNMLTRKVEKVCFVT